MVDLCSWFKRDPWIDVLFEVFCWFVVCRLVSILYQSIRWCFFCPTAITCARVPLLTFRKEIPSDNQHNSRYQLSDIAGLSAACPLRIAVGQGILQMKCR